MQREKDYSFDHIFLSPHLDDAVLSSGGLISRLIMKRQRVHIITFYTKEPDIYITNKFSEFANLENRKKEDEKALKSLGATYEWRDFTERLFRAPLLKSSMEVFRTPSKIKDFSNLDSIRETISGLLDRFPKTRIYSPLGIGNHYDHVELFIATMLTILERQTFDRVFFYEDIYSLCTWIRKRHFVSKMVVWKWKNGPELPQFNDLSNIIGLIRWYYTFYLINARTAGPTAEELLGERIKVLKWKVNPISITRQEEEAKLKAISMYESQIKPFGGITVLSKILKKYHKFWRYAEPYWIIRKAKVREIDVLT